jgi:predicted phage-related endonuclease
MKVIKFEDEEKWLEYRKGKITGTRLKDIISKNGTKQKKIGFYEIIADRISIPPDNENRLERGHRLEDCAIRKFEKKTGKKVENDLVMWVRGDNEDIALSPDGYIGTKEAVEVKCLASAKHIEAYLTQKIPSEYEYQVLQYFICNDDLERLYFVFYDNCCPIDMFYLIVDRADIPSTKIAEYLQLEKETLRHIDLIIQSMLF